jgi:hypothetical protein
MRVLCGMNIIFYLVGGNGTRWQAAMKCYLLPSFVKNEVKNDFGTQKYFALNHCHHHACRD